MCHSCNATSSARSSIFKTRRTSKRINFIGGIRGTPELEKVVQAGDFACAFSMFPTSMDDLMAISDQGGIMPPKKHLVRAEAPRRHVLPLDLTAAPISSACDPDHPAGDAPAGVARRLPAIVEFGVDDDRMADDRIMLAQDRDIVDRDFVVRLPLGVRLQIAQVARVAVVGGRGGRADVFRVIMPAGAHAVRG